jgi:hypothetical protein
MRKIDGDALYIKLLEADVTDKLVLDMVREAPEIENNKHLNGYMFDSLVYRYQLARQELAKYIAYYNSNRPLEQENRNANRDIMKFVQILDELVGEGNRD